VASAFIVTRRLPSGGRRYEVRFRLGGRETTPRYAGRFKSRRLAEERARWVAGELAARRVPDLRSLEAMPTRTLAAVAERYADSRVDFSDNSRMNLASHLKRILPAFGARDPSSITWPEVQDWVAAQDIAPASLVRYMATLRLVLDYAGVDPNPARDKRVRLPRVERPEPQPPTRAEFEAMLAEVVPVRWRLPLRVIEATGLRVGEIQSLRWADVDLAGCRLRVSRTRTKGGTAGQHWAQVPAPLMAEIDAICPPDDRTAGRIVFTGAAKNTLANAMGRACRVAGIAHYSPHDLRHRRLSLWHAQGVPARELAARAGHSRASMSLDVYSHVLLDGDDEWA
jgi:integrase